MQNQTKMFGKQIKMFTFAESLSKSLKSLVRVNKKLTKKQKLKIMKDV